MSQYPWYRVSRVRAMAWLALIWSVASFAGGLAAVARDGANEEAAPMDNHFVIDATAGPGAPETGYFEMGGPGAARAPDGRTLTIDSRSLRLDGRPWLPVMGEFHFSRYPAEFWEEELEKMKAGGVQIVSTYVFWIHHEELEGRFDWSGRRDLRRFVELCAKHGLYVWARIGPWAHGEVRNGGLPDWLLTKGPTRVNTPGYLADATRFYEQIGAQLRGLLWKDGGPVIGVQIENEYRDRGPEGGAAHIATLKAIAQRAGLDVPFYTVTGWDHTVFPPRLVAPVFGGYIDEPWSASLRELPIDGQGVYQFAPTRGNAGILQGAPGRGAEIDFRHYPRLTAELGAGLEDTYHRRVVVAPDAVAPVAIVALGSGVNLLGYYMYHGGTNPDGRIDTLQESQETGYPNDVPVKSYDFQAPLREFGQMNGSFRPLKTIHQFLADFGGELAPMVRALPDRLPGGLHDPVTLRVAARTLGGRGFVFFNNYLARRRMPLQSGVQVTLKLPGQTIQLPRTPVDVPAQTAFFWPVNLDLDGATLTYATAQPFAKLAVGAEIDYFFVTCRGIAPEFVFDSATVAGVEAKRGHVARVDGSIDVTGCAPSTEAAIDLKTRGGKAVRIILVSGEQAGNLWKVNFAGRERMVLTHADLFSDGTKLHLGSRDAQDLAVAFYPDVEGAPTASLPLIPAGRDGLFAVYRPVVERKRIAVELEQVREVGAVPPVRMGPRFSWRENSVAQAPAETTFASAAEWRLKVPADVLAGVHDVFLSVHYVGDVARLYAGERLLDDNFFNGTPWEIGLRELPGGAASRSLRLEILPLRSDAPIFLPNRAAVDFRGQDQSAQLISVEALPEYELVVAAPAAH